MKRALLSVTVAAAAFVSLSGPASAAPWQSINQRQANLYDRIEQGIRSGSLTRGEADRLRARFANITRLEDRYRQGGLSGWERRDLDMRFNSLSRDIRWQKHDDQNRRYR